MTGQRRNLEEKKMIRIVATTKTTAMILPTKNHQAEKDKMERLVGLTVKRVNPRTAINQGMITTDLMVGTMIEKRTTGHTVMTGFPRESTTIAETTNPGGIMRREKRAVSRRRQSTAPASLIRIRPTNQQRRYSTTENDFPQRFIDVYAY